MTLPFRQSTSADDATDSMRDETEFSNAPSVLDVARYLDASGNVDWTSALRDSEPWIRGVIAKRVGETAAVDEVFQEVALAVANQREPLRDPSKLGAWLYRTTVLQSALYRRKAGRKRNFLKRYESDLANSTEERAPQEPLDWLICQEREELVRAAVAQLPIDDQRILMMKYSEDKSYQEIANELGATTLAVQSKLHRARKRLKEILNIKVADL